MSDGQSCFPDGLRGPVFLGISLVLINSGVEAPPPCPSGPFPTPIQRWSLVQVRGFQHFKSSGPDRDRTGGELPCILSLSLNFQPSESGRKAELSMNGSYNTRPPAPPFGAAPFKFNQLRSPRPAARVLGRARSHRASAPAGPRDPRRAGPGGRTAPAAADTAPRASDARPREDPNDPSSGAERVLSRERHRERTSHMPHRRRAARRGRFFFYTTYTHTHSRVERR